MNTWIRKQFGRDLDKKTETNAVHFGMLIVILAEY